MGQLRRSIREVEVKEGKTSWEEAKAHLRSSQTPGVRDYRLRLHGAVHGMF